MMEQEGDLGFDFSKATAVEKFDRQATRQPEGMQLVDFVVEEARRLIMVEIKDPSCKPKRDTPAAQDALDRSRTDFSKKIQNDSLIADDLVPKGRDTYTYLHLMKREGKPLLYAFLLGADQLSIDHALLLAFKDRLLARLRHEADQPWARQYVADCIVLTEKTWPLAFPQFPMKRLR